MWENACRIKLFNCNVLHRLHPKNEKNSGNELFSVPVLMTKSSEDIWHHTSNINRKPAFQVGILNCRISRFELSRLYSTVWILQIQNPFWGYSVAKHKGRFWIYVSVSGFTWKRNVPEHMTTVEQFQSLQVLAKRF